MYLMREDLKEVLLEEFREFFSPTIFGDGFWDHYRKTMDLHDGSVESAIREVYSDENGGAVDSLVSEYIRSFVDSRELADQLKKVDKLSLRQRKAATVLSWLYSLEGVEITKSMLDRARQKGKEWDLKLYPVDRFEETAAQIHKHREGFQRSLEHYLPLMDPALARLFEQYIEHLCNPVGSAPWISDKVLASQDGGAVPKEEEPCQPKHELDTVAQEQGETPIEDHFSKAIYYKVAVARSRVKDRFHSGQVWREINRMAGDDEENVLIGEFRGEKGVGMKWKDDYGQHQIYYKSSLKSFLSREKKKQK